MKRVFLILLLATIFIATFINSSDKGAHHISNELETQKIRGDVVELQGKSMFYHNKYGSYPIYPDNVYELADSKVVKGVKVLERYFKKDDGSADTNYIQENIKLVDDGKLKNGGIMYQLASENSIYFLDTKTGKIISPDLLEGDPDYAGEITDRGEYRVLEVVTIEDNAGNLMNEVNGSFNSGSGIYFYGKGSLIFARRDEITRQIVNLNSLPELADIKEILYIQPSTLKMAAVNSSGEVIISQLKLP